MSKLPVTCIVQRNRPQRRHQRCRLKYILIPCHIDDLLHYNYLFSGNEPIKTSLLISFLLKKMFSKHGSFKLFTYFRYHHSCLKLRPLVVYNLLSTTATESPVLPSWIKSSTSENTDEDFVIPSLVNWIESHKPHDQSKLVSEGLSEKSDTDVDRISKILKNKFPSPDEVVRALNGFCLSASDSLIQQVLRRFSHDWVPAYGAFIWAKTQTGYRHAPEVYDHMVDIMGKVEKFDIMWDLVKEMDGLNDGYVTLSTMSRVMRRLARSGKYEEAIDAFRGLDKFGLEKDARALNVIVDALAKERSVEHAYAVFCEFKDCIEQFNVEIFNALISGWCKARKLEEAERMMDEMRKMGFVPDVVSYTCFIEYYCSKKDFRKVDEILQEMQRNGCKPNIVTYTIVMHAYGKAKQVKEALEVYQKMKNDGCLADAMFYSSMIYILSKAGRIKDADEIFEDMKKQGVMPNILTYNTMISSACVHSLEEKALKLLQIMVEDSCKPEVRTYTPLLKMCCRKKRLKVLKFLLSHMFNNDVSIDPATYIVLIRGLCMSGELKLAYSIFEDTVSKGMILYGGTYKLLLEKLDQNNMHKEKENVVKLMSQIRVQGNRQQRLQNLC